MTGKRTGTSKQVSPNGDKESNRDIGAKRKRTRSRRRKRRRNVWAIEVSNVTPTAQVMGELERFFIKRVCPWEKKLLSKGFANCTDMNDLSSRESPKKGNSFFFEFINQPQQQAALKLDGITVGKGRLKIRPWIVNDSVEDKDLENDLEDSLPLSSPGIFHSTEMTTRPTESDHLPQHEIGDPEKPRNGRNLSLQQLEVEIEAKDRLLAASNEHIKVLTEMNSKYEKRVVDQFNKIEDLNARLQGQEGQPELHSDLADGKAAIQPQQQLDESICSQAKRIGDLEADLKIQQLHNVAKDEKIRRLETALANRGDAITSNQQRQQEKIANQKREIAKLHGKLNKHDQKDDDAPFPRQPTHSSQTLEGRVEINRGKGHCSECLRAETSDITSLITTIEALKVDLMDTIVLRDFAVEEKTKLQKQLDSIVGRKETTNVELMTKMLRLSAEKQVLENKLNFLTKENESMRTDFLAQGELIQQNVDIVEKELKSLQFENQRLVSSTKEREEERMVTKQSMATLKEAIQKLKPELIVGEANGLPTDIDILQQQLHQAIEAKQRLLVAASAHIDVLAESSNKYEKRLLDQTIQMEEPKTRTPFPQGEKEKAKNGEVAQCAKEHQEDQEKQIQKLETKAAALETKVFALEAEEAAKTEKIGKQRLSIANLNKQVKSLENEVATKREKIINQKDQLASLNKKRTKQKPKVAAAKIQKLSAEKQAHETTIAIQKRQIAELQAKLNNADARDATRCTCSEKDTQSWTANGQTFKRVDKIETAVKEEPKEEILEDKLIRALQDQNKLLEENRQLRLNQKSLQQTISTLESCAEENERLQEEIEQMRMNQAMEMGFMEGSAL